MSQIETRQFQVEADSKFPFAPSKTPKGAPSSKGPKGSIWGLAHLNWLHLKFSCGYNWEELFPSENGLNQSSAVVSKLKEELGKEWPWICNNEHHSLSIYAIFKRLAYQRREDDEYKTDTYASSDLSPAPTLRQSSSPPQMRQSGMSRQDRETTPTPHPTGPYTSPSTSGPSDRRQRPLESMRTPPPRTREMIPPNTPGRDTPTYHRDREGLTSSSQTTPRSQVTYGAFESGFGWDSSLRRLVEEEEKDERDAQKLILQTGVEEEDEPSEAASEGKSEIEVQHTGRAFLAIVREAMSATQRIDSVDQEHNLNILLEDAHPFELRIDGIDMTVESDQTMVCEFGKPGQRKSVEVMVEFKKRGHKLSATRILGQECAELLGAAVAQKELSYKWALQGHNLPGSYTSYLISWHGLMAYVSRFDATYEFLRELKQRSKHLQTLPPPSIRRSRLLNLTVTQDRIDLATIAARIAIEQISQYSRGQKSGLIDRLTATSALVESEARQGLRPRLCDDCRVTYDMFWDRLCGGCRDICDSYQQER